jgi:hypothetical protein
MINAANERNQVITIARSAIFMEAFTAILCGIALTETRAHFGVGVLPIIVDCRWMIDTRLESS